MPVFHRKKASALREAIAVSSAKDHLYNLPEYLAKLIEDFEARDVHPQYREDVYKTLAATVNICRTVINPTFPAGPAIEEIGQLMTMLPRMLTHLSTRPTTTGFAIMIPHTREIFPSIYSTEAEAQAQLRQIVAFSPGARGIVIPVRLTSEVVQAPIAPKRTVGSYAPLTLEAHEDPIPAGIKPTPKQLGFEDLMGRVAAVEGDVGQHIPPLVEPSAPPDWIPTVPRSEGLSPPVSEAPEGSPAAGNSAGGIPLDWPESPRTMRGGPGNANP